MAFSERTDVAHSPVLKPEDAFTGSDGLRVWSGAYQRPLKAKKEKNHTDLSMRARAGVVLYECFLGRHDDVDLQGEFWFGLRWEKKCPAGTVLCDIQQQAYLALK